jgi:hypothetical protein
MTAKERAEHLRLTAKWAKGKATMREMRRCMDLDRKAATSTVTIPAKTGMAGRRNNDEMASLGLVGGDGVPPTAGRSLD